MTGSGACVFAEFADETQANKVLSQLPVGMRGIAAKGLMQHPLKEYAVSETVQH
jgi:4-diphosphocytidyl-2-C-methyl-D-erythritol kinase